MQDNDYKFIIALDNNEEACGGVYKDDGYTFNYKNGIKLTGEIYMKNSQISYEVNDGLGYKNQISSIIILGLLEKPLEISIKGQDFTRILTFYDINSALVINMKGISINESWKVSITSR